MTATQARTYSNGPRFTTLGLVFGRLRWVRRAATAGGLFSAGLQPQV